VAINPPVAARRSGKVGRTFALAHLIANPVDKNNASLKQNASEQRLSDGRMKQKFLQNYQRSRSGNTGKRFFAALTKGARQQSVNNPHLIAQLMFQ
jgi:hypothetical protein